MLTKKELCQCILLKAKKKFNKTMTDLDVYYAGPEVGLALAFLGMIQDSSTLDYVKNVASNSVLFTHGNGNSLTYLELLNMLPPDATMLEQEKEIEKKEIEEKKELTWDEYRQNLGERNFYRLLDLLEHLNSRELLEMTISALNSKLNALSDQSPAI